MRHAIPAGCAALLLFVAGSASALAPTPSCDGEKKPTDQTEQPPKASTEPMCDGEKKPTDETEQPPKASTEPMCDGEKKPTDETEQPPKS